MVSRSLGRVGLLGAALAMSLVLGGCNSSTATPAPVQPTLTPVPIATATPAPTDTPTPAPTATPAPSDTPTAAPTDTPAATESPTPAPLPTLPASVLPCTGSDGVKHSLADQVPHLSFDLYCAVLPSGWGVVQLQADYDKGGLIAQYKNAAGNTVDVYEGSFCTMSPNPCSGNWTPVVGNTAFGPLTGELDGSGTSWSIVVHTSNAKVMYTMIGAGMDQATMKSYAAALHKIS
jgi:hypothetical protein